MILKQERVNVYDYSGLHRINRNRIYYIFSGKWCDVEMISIEKVNSTLGSAKHGIYSYKENSHYNGPRNSDQGLSNKRRMRLI
jgi:hypothetical protein